MTKKNINLVEKKELASYVVNSNIKSATKYDVLSIATILFEEIYDDLKSGIPLIVKNFGKLELKNKNYSMEKENNKIIRKLSGLYYNFTFERKIHLKLIRSLDIDSLGKDEQNKEVK